MTTAFITGIGGQDGTLLTEQLCAQGVTVHGLVRSEAERRELVVRLPVGTELHVGDLRDASLLEGLVADVAPDEVYNLAGVSSVAQSWREPVLTGEVNGVGAVGVFEAASALQERSGRAVRVVQASSAEIFGRPSVSPQDEATPVRPTSPYGAAKAYAHQMAAVYRLRGLHVATCILYNHESELRPTTFVTRKITAAAARIARTGEGTIALGDTAVRRDWGWAADYVDALVRAARHAEPDDFVIATGSTHSVAEFLEVAMLHAGVDDWRSRVTVDDALLRPAEAFELVGDPTKAREVLGWAPTTTFHEVVARMVDHDLALARSAS